ncbi:50S ribosomal subunit protein L4 [Candidatus Hodgkinia cicadicola]|nr:50S ribosomal subunit protein L4 [Candidatus Hodgkinia cicadicola]
MLIVTPEAHSVLASSVNFEIYPRLDIISEVVRWQLDKRRWHVAQIKSRTDISCSNNKRYAQKGLGRARHATSAVSQFRGGGKYAAKKVCVRLRLNKKLKTLAIRSCLSLKRASNSLYVLDSFSQVTLFAFNKPLLVYYSASEIKAIAWRDRTPACVCWCNLNVVQIVRAQELVFSARALEMLDVKLTRSI